MTAMSDEMIPGLVTVVAGCCAWLAVLAGAWLSPLLPPPAGAPFRILRAAPVASATAMWAALAGLLWMAAAGSG